MVDTRHRSTKPLLRDAQGDMFEKSYEEELEARKNTPVTCLGIDFPNDDARREYFLSELAKKLRDPEFRKIEGFPIGEDEDILALSDPPYYTACPNPWLGEWVQEWERTKPSQVQSPKAREPYATDVTEGRYSPETLCHSYHTKVPARAVLRYILHYTNPGDIVLDGFCGSGMTGVACRLAGCADSELRAKIATEMPDARWGHRRAIVSDLSPAATCIANAYNDTVPVGLFKNQAKALVNSALEPVEWMFRTATGQDIFYSLWSDVFSCPNCGGAINYFLSAVAEDRNSMKTCFSCDHCGSEIGKRTLDRVMATYLDPVSGRPLRLAKCALVSVNHAQNGKRVTRSACPADQVVLERVMSAVSEISLPLKPILKGDRYYKDGLHLIGIEYYHQMYPFRNALSLCRLRNLVRDEGLPPSYYMLLTATALKLSWMARYMFDAAGRIQNGILYIPSLRQEMAAPLLLRKAVDYIARYRAIMDRERCTVISTESCTDLRYLPNASVDYIFTDPPFGHNIQYSELNAVWEYWLAVESEGDKDAVINKSQGKDLAEYHRAMAKSFSAYFRVLKPGRWMTVEFHNSRNSVWNTIQECLQSAGFVVADVRALDKKQGAFNQIVAAGAVKKDLVISAYRPHEELEQRFALEAGSEAGAWEFVREHLSQLPVFVSRAHQVETLAERLNYMLFDRMVAFHVQRGSTVPLSASEFYRGLEARFPQRDSMFFLPVQVSQYDKSRSRFTDVRQLELFVQDEASAIAWLRQHLEKRPQSFAEIHPAFLREIGAWQKHEKPLELRELLEDNFLCYGGTGEVPSQIHAYLSTNWKVLRSKVKDDPELVAKAKGRWYVPDPKKAEDLEKVRERGLLREFWEYLPDGYKPQVKADMQAELPGLAEVQRFPTSRRMKVIRSEAVRAGFKFCWQNQDYRTIITVAKRIPEDVLQEDQKLLMWYDQALTRLGEE